MTWPEVAFQSLYELPSRNGIYKAKSFHGSGAKIVNMGELFKYNFVGPQEMARLRVDDSEQERFGLQDGDLLFARRSLVEAGAGKCVVVEGVTEPTVFESSLIRVRLSSDTCNPRYYYYYFGCPPGRSRIEAIITGVAQKGIRSSDLASITVHHPDLPTQHRIADILSAYDDLIENNNRRMALLEEAIHLLYREWFVYLRFPGHERVKVVDGVPEGWELTTVGDLAEIVRGKSYRSDELSNPNGKPFVTLKNIDRGGGFRLPGLKAYSGKHKDDQVLAPGDILIAVTDMGQKREIVARAARVPQLGLLHGAVFSMDLVKCVPRSDDDALFIYGLLRASSYADEVKNHANGVNVLHLKPNRVLAYRFLCPPSNLRLRFAQEVSAQVELFDNLWRTNLRLREARDLLLPRLMNGSIAV